MKKHSLFLILILFSLFISGCKYDFIVPVEVPPVDNGGNPISFASQVAPIFAEKCNSCHNNQAPVLTADIAYSKIVPNYINATTPENSPIYTKAASGTHYAKVSATQAAVILTWIKEGALKN